MANELQYKCFLEVANRLSFTQAASVLFITQQACSKYIAALESELGFSLFERSTRKVTLTEDGKRLRSVLMRFKQEYEAVIEIGRQRQNAQEITIKFGLMNGTSPSVLIDGVQYAKTVFPKLKFVWHYGEQHELSTMVYSGDLDMALIFYEGAEARPTLLWQPLFKFHGYLLISSQISQNAANIPYDIIAKMPFAAHKQFGLSAEESLNEAKIFLKKFKLPYSDIILHESIDDSLASVETAECFTVTPPIFQHAFFVPYLSKYPLEHVAEIGCVWNAKNTNSRIEQIVQTIAEASRKSELHKQLLKT